MTLTQDEILRYSRHLIMPEVGVEGQEKLKAANVLLIGTGGLGSPAALYLAAAGVGTLGLVDFDKVDFSNLQRQIIHGTSDVDQPKVESAKKRLAEINPNVKVVTYDERLTRDNVLEILKDYEMVIDGTDNFQTRYLVNDACVFTRKPFVYGSIFRFDGQATVFYPGKGPCYRCLFAEPPPPGMVPSCAEGGVLGILPGVIGVIQATEVVKLILGKGEPLIGRLLLYDALKMNFREVKFRKNPKCPVCGEHPTIKELVDYEAFCGLTRGAEEKNDLSAKGILEITVLELKKKMDRREKFVLIDVREPSEFKINRIAGAKLIPLGSIPERVHELDSADEIVMHCHFGGRSAKAVAFLQKAGFKKVWNLAGGIDAWSRDVDPNCPRY
ncbi:MAG: molybdenum cofactor biosynthesis protein MoeB [Candidatus Omnitrophica bacterium CG07_land_8_20_14_0_80_50_8]|nr:MAG: molybdenum cofactor biosynthesis protein MoeB [Candidatus Omnitrophica bacterium CG07_land_8_20_14_0_80_50_8]